MKQKIILILGFWISTQTIFLQAQVSTPLADFAEIAYVSGNHELALKEFLRSHFVREKPKEIPVTKRISDLFVLQKNYKLALQYLDFYYFENKGNSQLQSQISLDKVRIHLLQENPKAALYEAFQISPSRFQDKDKLYFYTALALLSDLQYEEGFLYLKKISYLEPKDYVGLDALQKKMVKNNRRNPKNARWWSVLTPGLGQMIYGDVEDGLISLGLMAGLTYVLIDVGLTLTFPDALLSVGPWWGRYYIGGLGNAVDQAQKHKEDTSKKLLANLLNVLESNKYRSK